MAVVVIVSGGVARGGEGAASEATTQPAATQGDFARELAAAKGGDVKAMVKVGEAYENGEGVGRNPTRAVAWYQKAAEAGDARAMDWVGDIYIRGTDVAVDQAKGIAWLTKAAKKGDPTAKRF